MLHAAILAAAEIHGNLLDQAKCRTPDRSFSRHYGSGDHIVNDNEMHLQNIYICACGDSPRLAPKWVLLECEIYLFIGLFISFFACAVTSECVPDETECGERLIRIPKGRIVTARGSRWND